jgi:hypothetical protein
MLSSKRGRTTSTNKPVNKRPNDPIDRLIIEHGLRIKDVYIDKSLDLLLLVLNNGQIIRSGIAEHKRLKSVGQSRLEKWELLAGGTGITWPDLDEDLSLRGFIHAASLEQTIRSLADPKPKVLESRKGKASRR